MGFVFSQKGHSERSQRRDMKLWQKRGESCYGTEHKDIKQYKCDINQLEGSTISWASRLCHGIFLGDGALICGTACHTKVCHPFMSGCIYVHIHQIYLRHMSSLSAV